MTFGSTAVNNKENMSRLEVERDAISTVLAGGGEMGALMRLFDWGQTSLGPVAEWPQGLKTAVRIILTSRYPMFVWWGRQMINLYNDPYRPFLGNRHPEALGKPAWDAWSDIWDQIGPRADAVLLRGESTYDEALLLLMGRHGYLEETYFTFSYSPLPKDDGTIGGLFCAVTEETQRVIGERRLKLLREIAAAMAAARTPADVCMAAASCLATAQRDLPFSLIYLVEPDCKTLSRVCETGLTGDHALMPVRVALEDDTESVWPFRQVLESGQMALVEKVSAQIPGLPAGVWNRPPEHAVLVPIAQQGQSRPAGILMMGLNPHRRFDDEFRGFISLLTNHIAAAIANAVAYEAERQRADALAQLDHAKTLFFSNVSHEFRTPLTLMLGPVEEVLANAQERLLPQDREQLVVARRNALRLLKLVNTLLDFSRIEAGRVQAIYEPADLAGCTVEVASVFRSAMEKAGLAFHVSCEPLPEPVYVDREMWEKVVLNLLSNAFKFTFAGEVSVTLKPAGEAVELIVRDTGVGIPDHEVARVFERFYRIGNTRARTHEGTGIGLAFVRELVKLHGGTVQVSSTLGQGSTFTISIPRGNAHLPQDRIQVKRDSVSASSAAETYIQEAERWLPQDSEAAPGPAVIPKPRSSDASPSAPQAAERQRIVLADDNADMRDYVARLLARNYEVHTARDGEEAVEAVLKLRPVLVLADIMMPRLDGFGLLRVLRSHPECNTIPVILLSARAGEDSRVEGFQAGADDYLVKPFTARELQARVATHVKMANMRREAAERETELRAQAELERHRLGEVLAHAPAAIGVLSGPDHCWVYVNDFYVQVTGRKSHDDFIGKTLRQSLPELEGQGFIELMDEAYQTGKPFVGREAKARLQRSDGRTDELYFDFVYQPIRDRSGNVERILVHATEVTERVMTRKAIQVSEERFRLAQSAAHIGSWAWNPAKDVHEASAELHRMLGTDPEDPRFTEVWASRVESADWSMVQEQMETGFRAGNMEFEYRYRHPQSGLRWFYSKGRRLNDESRMFGILLDITDRKRAELRSSAQYRVSQTLAQSRDLFEAAPEILCTVCEVLDWNVGGLWVVEERTAALRCVEMLSCRSERGKEFARVSRSRSFAKGIGLPGRVWESGRPHWIQDAVTDSNFPRLAIAQAEGLHAAFGFPILSRGQVLGVLEFFSGDIREPDDDLLEMMGSIGAQIGQYIERVQVQHEHRKLAAVVESSDDAIVSKDLTGIVTSWNAGAEKMFGYTAEEMIGRSILTVIPPELHSDEQLILETISRGERIEHFETVRITRTGQRIEVSLTISPLKDETGRIIGIGKIARDITQRRKAEQALRTAEKLASVGRLASTVAHEVNNPLEAVTNLVYLARNSMVQEDVRKYLAMAEEELERVSHVTRQTLGFYRETNMATRTRIGALIGPLLSIFSTKIRNRPIEIKPEIKQDPEITVVPGEVRQLLANLLSNSFDAVQGTGTIRLRLSAAREWNVRGRKGVRLTVADSGAGIPVANRSRLFEPFFTTKEDVGTGLGLWVCNNIVEKHKGRIQVKSSVTPGRSWTAFSVFLPLGDPTAAPIAN